MNLVTHSINSVLLILLLLFVIGDASIGDSSKILHLTPAQTTDECLLQMQNLLTPQQIGDLTNMVLKSGKGLNQLGLYEGCNDLNDFEYVLLSIKQKANNFAIIRVGVCAPKKCASQEYFKWLIDAMINVVSALMPDPIYGTVEVPKEILSTGIDGKAWVMIFVIIAFIFLWILGIAAEFTKFGDYSKFSDEEIEQMKVEDRKSKLGLFFYSFSPFNNIKKLFTVSKNGDQSLAVLNGVRVLSIGWVVIGHSFNFLLLSPLVNITNMPMLFESRLFALIPGGVYAVDTFFFLSGLLSCYLLAIKMYPKKGSTSFLLIYFHRYYRLIFTVLFVEGVTVCLMLYLGDGPMYRQTIETMSSYCSSYWWSNLLFINNLIPWKMTKQCISWVWYLANDFQFFLITPPIVYVFCKNRMAAYLLMMFLMLLSMLFNGIVAGIYNVSITGNSKEIPTEDIVYEKPWSRVGAYLVGCFIGFSIFELKLKEKYRELSNTFFNSMYLKLQESRILSLIFSIVGTGFTSMVIFPLGGAYTCKEENCWARFPSALYAMLARPLFVFGVGLIVMPTIVGRLRFLIHFLGSETFSVLARLTYVVYMIHIVIMLWVLLDVRQGLYASSLGQWIFGIGTCVISFLVAIPVSMMCEVPFLNIEKYLLFPQRKIQDKPNKEFEKESMLIKKNEGLEYSDNMTRDSK